MLERADEIIVTHETMGTTPRRFSPIATRS